jgi:hypothetical protein
MEKYLLPKEYVQITLIEKRESRVRCALATHAGVFEIGMTVEDYELLAGDLFFDDGVSEVYHIVRPSKPSK